MEKKVNSAKKIWVAILTDYAFRIRNGMLRSSRSRPDYIGLMNHLKLGWHMIGNDHSNIPVSPTLPRPTHSYQETPPSIVGKERPWWMESNRFESFVQYVKSLKVVDHQGLPFSLSFQKLNHVLNKIAIVCVKRKTAVNDIVVYSSKTNLSAKEFAATVGQLIGSNPKNWEMDDFTFDNSHNLSVLLADLEVALGAKAGAWMAPMWKVAKSQKTVESKKKRTSSREKMK
jgi:hypothetical protein